MDTLRTLWERRIVKLGLAIGLVGIAVLLILLWQVGVFDSPPPPASLQSAEQSLAAQQEQRQASEPAQPEAGQPQSGNEDQASEQQEQAAAPQSAGAAPSDDGYGGISTSADQQASEEAQPASSTVSASEQQQESPSEHAAEQAATEEREEPAASQQEAATQQSSVDTQGSAAAPTLAELAGTWILSEQGESFVGYRVGEELANIGTTTAVGRTRDVTVDLQFDGSAITTVTIVADLTTLRSDESFRDRALRSQGIETNIYPTATFILTEPIPIDVLPSGEETLDVTVQGTLELHGVTNVVEIALEGRYVDGFVLVAGSTEIVLEDYDIEKPSAMIVVSIEDSGIMEFQLVLERVQ